ncbi:MAG: ABC transporter substrate-binding protein [Candidatus Micrarchaeia archaeon]
MGNGLQIANPASVNCINHGGVLSIVSEPGGERGICTLSDGTVCDEWAYYRGECPLRTGPASDEIKVKVVPQNMAKEKLENGEIDYYLSPLNANDIQAIKSDANAKISLYPATSTIMGLYVNPAPADYGFNPFSSRNARFALNFLINRDKIASEVYDGEAFAILSSPWPGHPSYDPISSEVGSFNITYNKQKGMLLLNEAMVEAGAVMINGTWDYNGTPIILILPLYNGTDGSEDMQKMTGLVADDLKAAGFEVQMLEYDNYSKAPHYSSDPRKMQWHVVISGSIFYGMSKYQSAYSLGPSYEEGWWKYENSNITAAKNLLYNSSTPVEWNRANSKLAGFYIEDSVGLWLVALNSNFGAGKDVNGIVNDSFVGIRSYGTPRQANVPGKKSLVIGVPYLYDGQASWNPVVVEHIYMMDLLNIMHDPAKQADPKNLEEMPYRWGFEIEKYPSPQKVPSDSFIWSATEKKWVSVPADATAVAKVTYNLSRYVCSKWHNGQTISWADVIYFIASTSDRLHDSEKQKISSEQFKEALDSVVGYRINGNKLETYMSIQNVDDGEMLPIARISQRIAPFEIYAANDELVFAKKKYSYGDVLSNLTSLSLVEAEQVKDVLLAMESLTDAQVAPMVTLGGKNYLENGMLAARLQADKEWNIAHGHLVISDGAFYVDYYNQTDGSVRLLAFRDQSYPFAAGNWIDK